MPSIRFPDGKISIKKLFLASSAIIFCLWMLSLFFDAEKRGDENRAGHNQPNQPSGPSGFSALGVEKAFNPVQVVDATARKIKAFILIGQSNMVGRAERSKFAPIYIAQEKNGRVLRLYPSGWGRLEVFVSGNGPEVSFAHAMAEAWPDDSIGIIKVAIEGTGIRGFIPAWDRELAGEDARKGPIYQDHIRPRVRLAKKLCPDIEFAGVLWKQGGADMKSSKLASGYTGHLAGIINALRKDTGVKDLPLFVGAYVGRTRLDETFDHIKTSMVKTVRGRPAMYDILKAQAFAEDHIPHTTVVVHGQLPLCNDKIHFSTEGQTTLGKLFANSVLAHYDHRRDAE